MRNALTVAALMLLLSFPVSAGIVNNPGSPQPIPTPTSTYVQPAPSVEETLTAGESSDGASFSLTEIALEILSILPSLL